MSIPVELAALRERIVEYGNRGYLLTVGPDGRPHSVGIDVGWTDDLLLTAPGNSTVANAAAHPLVALLWPPTSPGGHSLIVDAEVVSAVGGGQGDNSLTLRPTKRSSTALQEISCRLCRGPDARPIAFRSSTRSPRTRPAKPATAQPTQVAGMCTS